MPSVFRRLERRKRALKRKGIRDFAPDHEGDNIFQFVEDEEHLAVHAIPHEPEIIEEAPAAEEPEEEEKKGEKLPKEEVDVVVIGAGLSGLSAAYEILKSKKTVRVLEARDRVGGRVLSNSNWVGRKNVEEGAELVGSPWVHTTWWEYALEFGLDLEVLEEDSAEEIPYKMTRTENLIRKEMKKIYIAMGKFAEEMEVNTHEPWNTKDAVALDRMSLGEWLETEGAKRGWDPRAVKAIKFEFETNNGVPTERQSLLSQLVMVRFNNETGRYRIHKEKQGEPGAKRDDKEQYIYFWTEGETHRCRGGNSSLPHKFYEAITPEKITLNAQVTRVKSIEEGARVRVVYRKEGARGVVLAKKVVLAVPPSVVKQIRFNPALEKVASAPQIGKLLKVLNIADKRSWEEGPHPRPLDVFKFGMCWETTTRQGKEPPYCFTVFMGGRYLQRFMNKGEHKYEWLWHWIEKKYNVKSAISATKLVAWPQQEFTKAGYSCPAPGEVTAIGEKLHQPLFGGKVHLAGEHVCRYRAFGFMEGALLSGRQAARAILRDLPATPKHA